MSTKQNFLKISSIDSVSSDVALIAKILSLQQKALKNDKGESMYYYGILGDETGTIPFTAWTFSSSLRVGDVIEIEHASSREYNGTIRLNIDARSQVVMKPGTDMEVKRSYSEKKIRDLSLKEPFVTVKGKISGVIEKEKEKNGEMITLYYGNLEDDTAVIRVTSFSRKLEEGETVKMVGAKVSEYNGRLRLTISDKTQVEHADLDFKIGIRLSNISDVKSPISGVSLAAVIVNIGAKSGVIKRCKTCNRKIDDDFCEEHPNDGFYKDLFAYFTAEDGTGYVHCTSGKSPLEEVLGLTPDPLEAQSITSNQVIKKLNETLLGKSVVISGDFVKNNDSLAFRARTIKQMSEDDLRIVQIFEAEEII